MLDLSYIIPSMTDLERNKTEPRDTKVTNPYSGKSEMLTVTEYATYFLVKYAERIGDYKAMQKGLDKFSRLNPKAYMTLLD